MLCLIGDVFLMLPADRLVPGLVAFLFAHVAFSISLVDDAGYEWYRVNEDLRRDATLPDA